MDALEGRVVVVTGGASGIGAAMVRRFAADGMSVVVSDLDAVGIDAIVEELTGGGTEALGVVTDVADPAAVEALRDAAFERFGTVHVVCNNAGVGGGGAISKDIDLAGWHRTVDIDLFGIVHGVRAFLPRLLEQDEGHIVNTASRQGLVVAPGLGAYSAAKAAAVAVTESLHDELAAMGSRIGVSVVCPGGVRTRMLAAPGGGPRQSDDPEMQRVLDERYAAAVEPSVVADLVVAAIRRQRLYVLTHRETLDWMQARLDRIAADGEALSLPA
jgi:NAD(P)-dependent dehydrogenase (short-subunit alcohol dehydrogenase family)